MTDLRELFDEAIGEAPPSGVAVALVMRAERRRIRRARIFAATAVCAAGLVVALVGVLVMQPGSAPMTPAGPQPVPSPVESIDDNPISEPPTLLGDLPTEDQTQAQLRLTNVLVAALHRVAPTLHYDQALLAAIKSDDYGVGYMATFMVTAGGKTSQFHVQIGRGREKPNCGLIMANDCSRYLGPDGPAVLSTLTLNYSDTHPLQTERIATVLRPDGTLVQVSCRNQSGMLENDPATAYPPVVTPEQLAAIAQDPGFTLYPH